MGSCCSLIAKDSGFPSISTASRLHVEWSPPELINVTMAFLLITDQDTFFVRERACFDDVNQNKFHWLFYARAIFFLCYVTKERFKSQNEFVRFKRVFAKRGNFLLNHLKWELLGVLTKKKEKRKRNWKGVLTFRLFKSVILFGFFFEKNSRFLSAVKVKLIQEMP